jgi:hypothetical protein
MVAKFVGDDEEAAVILKQMGGAQQGETANSGNEPRAVLDRLVDAIDAYREITSPGASKPLKQFKACLKDVGHKPAGPGGGQFMSGGGGSAKPEPSGRHAARTTLADGTEVHFVPHPKQRRDETMVMLDPARFDADWSADSMYIEPGAEGAGGKRAAVEAFLETGKPVEASRGGLDADGKPYLDDGRHRFAVLRDRGAGAVAMTVPKDQAEELLARYGVDQKTMRRHRQKDVGHKPAGPGGGQFTSGSGSGSGLPPDLDIPEELAKNPGMLARLAHMVKIARVKITAAVLAMDDTMATAVIPNAYDHARNALLSTAVPGVPVNDLMVGLSKVVAWAWARAKGKAKAMASGDPVEAVLHFTKILYEMLELPEDTPLPSREEVEQSLKKAALPMLLKRLQSRLGGG